MVVLDASTVFSWTFVDKRDAHAAASAKVVLEHGAVVPAIWGWEIQNGLLAAERRKRITEAEVAERLHQIAALPIEIEVIGPAIAFGAELSVARRMNLSVYDAAYLELALRRGIMLITRDQKLGEAAELMRIRWKA